MTTGRSGWVRDVACSGPRPDRRIGIVAAVGFLASTMVAVGGVLAGYSGGTNVWFAANPLGSPVVAGKVLYIAGAVILIGAWVVLVQLGRSGAGLGVRRVVAVSVLWMLPLAVGPPLFSKDVYVYAAEGELMSRGLDPYVHPIAALGANRYVRPVDPVYTGVPQPDGPLLLAIDDVAVRVSGHDEVVTIELLRLVELASLALAGLALVDLARRSGRDPAQTLALALPNPITLLALVAPANNHAVTVGLLAAGVALGRRQRLVPALAVCSLAAMGKLPVLLAVAYVAWDWFGRRPISRARIASLAAVLSLIAASLEVLGAVVLGLGWGWIGGWVRALKLVTIPTVFTPTYDVALLCHRALDALGVSVSLSRLNSDIRDLAYVVMAVSLVTLLLRSRRSDTVRNLALSLLIVVALGPVLLPYYLTWGVIVLASVAAGRYLALLIVTSLAGALLMLPQSADILSRLGSAGAALCVAVALAIASIPIDPLRRFGWGGCRRQSPHS